MSEYVYIVFEGFYDTSDIVAVFAHEEAARDFAKRSAEEVGRGYFEVEKHSVLQRSVVIGNG